MRIEAGTPALVYEVARQMRERDFNEFSAVSFAETRDDLAQALALAYGERRDTLCGYHKDAPVCIGGLLESRPNVVSLLFFATDLFPAIALPLTRFIRRQLFPRLRERGVHRIEAVSLAEANETHVWLQTLGLTRETGELRNYGKRGEAFVQFAWVADVR